MPNHPSRMATSLSYERSFNFSPAELNGFSSDDPTMKLYPVILNVHKNRAAFSNHSDADNFDASKPNIVSGDKAELPDDCDSFHIRFTMNVGANSRAPNTCEKLDLEDNLKQIAKRYYEMGGYGFLAERYAWNILNGSFMHRNYRICADKYVTIKFKHPKNDIEIRAECSELNLARFPGRAELRRVAKNVDVLIDAIEKALSTQNVDPLILYVEATGVVGLHGEVFPSQVFEEGNGDKSKKLVSRVLPDGRRQARINGVKIGNAIRRIDEWYGGNEVIPVEVYGFVQSKLQAFRPVSGPNFYNLLWGISETWVALLQSKTTLPNDLHYFMAMLIRGGVFAAPSNGKSKGKGKNSTAVDDANDSLEETEGN